MKARIIACAIIFAALTFQGADSGDKKKLPHVLIPTKIKNNRLRRTKSEPIRTRLPICGSSRSILRKRLPTKAPHPARALCGRSSRAKRHSARKRKGSHTKPQGGSKGRRIFACGRPGNASNDEAHTGGRPKHLHGPHQEKIHLFIQGRQRRGVGNKDHTCGRERQGGFCIRACIPAGSCPLAEGLAATGWRWCWRERRCQ